MRYITTGRVPPGWGASRRRLAGRPPPWVGLLLAPPAHPRAHAARTVYIADLAHGPGFNRIPAQMAGKPRPALTVAPVGKQHCGFVAEVDAIAAVAAD